MNFRHIAVMIFMVVLAGCSKVRSADVDAPKTLIVTSPDFTGQIPTNYATSPPKIVWSEPPAGTKELALIVDDPDAPTSEPYVHYVLTRIAPKGLATDPVIGKNESGKMKWESLEPPAGETHRYYFRLYALDMSLGDAPKSKAEVLASIKGHVLAWGELIGTYAKK